jgi:ketosteroid isomerase-like protein
MKLASATEGAGAEDLGDVRARLGLARALSSGDLDLAAACFSKEACFVTPDGTAIHGRQQIRHVLAQLIARRVEIEIEGSNVLGGDDVLLVSEQWRICSGSAANRLEQVTQPVLVMRRVEKDWKLVLAAPWGWVDGLR